MKEKRKFSYYNFDRLYSFAAFIMVVVGTINVFARKDVSCMRAVHGFR